jgi:hypothetical protein
MNLSACVVASGRFWLAPAVQTITAAACLCALAVTCRFAAAGYCQYVRQTSSGELVKLFEPVVPQQLWHPNFAAQIAHRNAWNEAVLTEWAAGLVDRDGKFVQEFQRTFNSSFWELYLNAILRERQCSVDFGFSSPDFAVTAPTPFCIEAAIASNARGGIPEHHHEGAQPPEDLNEFNRHAVVRLSNALQSKYAKFKKQYGLLPHVAGRPFVVAIAPFDRPNFGLQCQRAIEALLYSYYVDEEEWVARGVGNTPAPKASLTSVRKNNTAEIPHGLFLADAMPEVSAVIFSSLATWGKVRAMSADPNPDIHFDALALNMDGPMPHRIVARKADYGERLLDGLRVYHNRGALHPLDPAIFRAEEIMQSYWSSADEKWVHEQHEWQLLARRVLTQQPAA